MSLNEAETRAKLIDPAIHKCGWTEDMIRREVTAGTVDIIGGKAKRSPHRKADYVLRVRVNQDTQPVALALIEAKKESLPPGHGLEQAKLYAQCKRLNVRFVYSSNGHQFLEYDSFTGLTAKPRPIAEFPSPDELRARYEKHIGFSLASDAARPLLQPYTGGEGARRYYQDAAIRAVMEKIAQHKTSAPPDGPGPRALLSLATGAGKTFIAVNLLKRISDAGQLTRALFVCDRDELRTQGLAAFQNVFGSDAAAVFRNSDGENNAKNARIHIATYQTLGVENEYGDATFLTQFYPPDYFSHVVIDECHRSAWGKWSQVLKRNSKAAHVGLTATPRQLKFTEKTDEAMQDEAITANNIAYFGLPVYEYSLAQAIEDGYLAACQIRVGRVNLDDTGITKEEIIERSPTDALTGLPITAAQIDELYHKTQYEDRILLPDRVVAMCRDLFHYLLETGGPEQKTIIFCARDRHADEVAAELNNLYAAWCDEQGQERVEYYAFKCTAASSGNDQLPDLRASTRSHFIATTVDLLSTGVDVPCVRNIVFFKYMQSPISLYQMLGRGTRIDPPTGKLMFRVYDYTDATRLLPEEFVTAPPRPRGGLPDDGQEPQPVPAEPTFVVEGFEVHVTDAGRYVLANIDGQAVRMPLDEYKSELAARLVQQAHTLVDFRKCWINPTARHDLIDALVLSGYSPTVVQRAEGRDDYDLYDVLAELGWGMSPRTRHDRSLAFVYKHEDWLNSLPPHARAVIRAMAGQFDVGGTAELENPAIFRTAAVKKAGGLSALQTAGEPSDLLRETKARMFAA